MKTELLAKKLCQAPSRASAKVFAHPSQLVDQTPASAPRFDFVTKLAGTTGHFTVYYAKSLRQQGLAVAQAVLQKCEADYARLVAAFNLTPDHFNVVAAPLSNGHDGTGGAYHRSCLASDLYCDVQFSPQLNLALTSALVVAEEVEVFEAVQDAGWNCGASNGEGLSRVLAEDFYPGVLDGYSTAGAWLDSDRPDWVNENEPTDTDPVANGCSVLFLFWMRYQLGFGWDKICQAPGATLAQTYQTLTGAADAFTPFTALLEKHFPSGQPSGLATDNPFPL